MSNPEKSNKSPESDPVDRYAEPLPQIFFEKKLEINSEKPEEIQGEMERLRQEIEKVGETKGEQSGVKTDDPRIIGKIKGLADAPKEFGVRERFLSGVSELWFVDKALQRRAEWFIKNSGIEDCLKVNGQYLDVGTGKGHIVQRILEDAEKSGNPLLNYYGIDIADKPSKKVQRREAKRRGVSMRENFNPTNFSFASADELPFKDNSLDGVSYIFSIHHMSKEILAKVINEAKRVIKKDGQIFIAEDLAGTDQQRIITEKIDRRINLELGGEHNYKSDQEWQEYFDAMGLVITAKKFFDSGKVKHGFYVLKLKLEN